MTDLHQLADKLRSEGYSPEVVARAETIVARIDAEDARFDALLADAYASVGVPNGPQVTP